MKELLLVRRQVLQNESNRIWAFRMHRASKLQLRPLNFLRKGVLCLRSPDCPSCSILKIKLIELRLKILSITNLALPSGGFIPIESVRRRTKVYRLTRLRVLTCARKSYVRSSIRSSGFWMQPTFPANPTRNRQCMNVSICISSFNYSPPSGGVFYLIFTTDFLLLDYVFCIAFDSFLQK